ncbi:hypothetical protein U9M48_038615 [Paspalum notatum var. saurae]|uniref:Protein XRI1 n=1 Tax=Paspalum notatum var. saurae TaxID=547442 RepID=A0AAQ3UHV2_PASNO
MTGFSLATHLQQPQAPSLDPVSLPPHCPVHLCCSMETGQTVQESALHAGTQAWWPLDTMACSLELEDTSTLSSSSSFLLGWDPQLSYFGLGAAGAGGAADPETHARELELFVPNCMESLVSEASMAVATGLPAQQDAMAMAMPGELDELLQSLWDSDRELQDGGFSSCSVLKEASAISSQYDDHSDLSSILPTVPTSPDKTLTPAQPELSASSSSHCNVDLRASDTGGAQRQRPTTRADSSSKRSAPEAAENSTEHGDCRKRSRKAPASCTAGAGTVVAARPFTVVKPGGVDGGVTLADINEWILTPPARPVRHPVGEFACPPRALARDQPAPSGKTVAGFTRLHTAGRGTITIIRTRG